MRFLSAETVELARFSGCMKTVRFTEVVKAAGKPEPYTLWIDPKKDHAFQSALKQHRVLSVHQETVGTQADSAQVGYRRDPQAQILIFPKSLARFSGRKIVGLKYDLLEPPRQARRSKRSRP